MVLQRLAVVGVTAALVSAGVKCGGRPLDRAERLVEARVGERAVVEGVVAFVMDELLGVERKATVDNVRKKLGLSYAELEAERLVEEAVLAGGGVPEGEDVVEEVLYNPKDVPLGWDGRPIPYWMYKLHGLNLEFRCEVCGNAVYKGPRCFERHFTEGVHVAGLRSLGVGYSRVFMGVTGIADVVKLKERLTKDEEGVRFDEDAIEFEDGEGNVLNAKTYSDLVRQGLL